jgi:hypothetical protein
MNPKFVLSALMWLVEPWLEKVLWLKAKRRSIIIYLRALQTARVALFAALAVTVILHVMVLALFATFATFIFLVVDDEPLRLKILFGAFALLTVFCGLAVGILFSEKTWFKISGAQAAIDDILGQGSSQES